MKASTGISIDETVLKEAKQAAKREGRNFSNYVEWALKIAAKWADGNRKAVKK